MKESNRLANEKTNEVNKNWPEKEKMNDKKR